MLESGFDRARCLATWFRDKSLFEPPREKPSRFCDVYVEQIGCGRQVLHVTTAAPILLTVVWIYQCYTQHVADKEKAGEKGGGGEQRKPVSPTLCSYSRLKKDESYRSKAVEKLFRA